jgi:hypothetical protein
MFCCLWFFLNKEQAFFSVVVIVMGFDAIYDDLFHTPRHSFTLEPTLFQNEVNCAIFLMLDYLVSLKLPLFQCISLKEDPIVGNVSPQAPE